MASILRRVVAGPRAPHPEANLDLCYVTDNIIATSGPSSTYPSRAYRNPLPDLVSFLDSKHGDSWAIWEFRAEGTGYPDDQVYGRIHHYPWPDHHPPPFRLIPSIMASMRDWLRGHEGDNASKQDGVQVTSSDSSPAKQDDQQQQRVVVVHCKAGKGRSGSMAVSYLLSEEGWTREAALQRFTERRMRPGFGAGVSIPSQLRWIGYVERWKDCGKLYVEQTVEVTEVRIWGLREGVKLAIEGFVDEGKTIKTFHVFGKDERDDQGVAGVDTTVPVARDTVAGIGTALFDAVTKAVRTASGSKPSSRSSSKVRSSSSKPPSGTATPKDPDTPATGTAPTTQGDSTPSTTATTDDTTPIINTIFRPSTPLILPSNDINLAVERRAHASYGWTMVTAVGHAWFNCFFEGDGPERMRPATTSSPTTSAPAPAPAASGSFDIDWDAMDGIKGSSRKGARAFDRASIAWRVVPLARRTSALHKKEASADLRADASAQPPAVVVAAPAGAGIVIREPPPGQAPRETGPADWTGAEGVHDNAGVARTLGPLDGRERRDPDVGDESEGEEGIRRGVNEIDGAEGGVDSVKKTEGGDVKGS